MCASLQPSVLASGHCKYWLNLIHEATNCNGQESGTHSFCQPYYNMVTFSTQMLWPVGSSNDLFWKIAFFFLKFNIVVIHMIYFFSEMDTHISNNGDSSQIFPCAMVCICSSSRVHLGLSDFKDYVASRQDFGEKDILMCILSVIFGLGNP